MAKKPPIEVREIIKQLIPNMPELLEYREYVLGTGEREYLPFIMHVVKNGDAWLKIMPDATECGKPLDKNKRYTFKCYKRFNHENELKRIWHRCKDIEIFKNKMLQYVKDVVDIKRSTEQDIKPYIPII